MLLKSVDPSGWFEIEVGLQRAEIDELIDLLKMIRDDPDQHFHLTTLRQNPSGNGQLTFYQHPHGEYHNGSLSGRSFLPGEDHPEFSP
jgi:hypothetical protein